MTTEQFVIEFLLSGWAQAIHTQDSLIQVAQNVENWRKKYREAFENQLRTQDTDEKIHELRKAVAAILEIGVDSPELRSRLQSVSDKFSKAPN